MVSFCASNPWRMNLKGETDEEENEAVLLYYRTIHGLLFRSCNVCCFHTRYMCTEYRYEYEYDWRADQK